MSKLMWIAGILLTAAGIALGLMVFVSTAPVTAISLEAAAILLVGGILAIGLGGVVNAVEKRPAPAAEPAYRIESPPPPAAAIPEFGRKTAETPAAAVVPAAAAVVAAPAVTELSEPTKETIEALEQARRKIEQAFDPKPAAETPRAEEVAVAAEPPVAETPEEEEPASEETTEAEEVLEDGQLYVIEERVIRNRPARILSDGTVEAETDDGWMRFENLEHLDEYLDAMAPARS